MSLGPTFVMFSDRAWYRNPVLGEEDWFLCFDEDDPPEIVVKQSACDKGLDAKEIIKRMGVDAYTQHTKPVPCGERCFSHDHSLNNFAPAYSWFIYLNSPPPIKYLISHDGLSEKEPKLEGVYFDFKRRVEPPKSKTQRKLESLKSILSTFSTPELMLDQYDNKRSSVQVDYESYHYTIHYRVHGNYYLVSKSDGTGGDQIEIPDMFAIKDYIKDGKIPAISAERQFEMTQGKLKDKKRYKDHRR